MDVLSVMLHQGHVIARDGHVQHTVLCLCRCLDLLHLNLFLLFLLLKKHFKASLLHNVFKVDSYIIPKLPNHTYLHCVIAITDSAMENICSNIWTHVLDALMTQAHRLLWKQILISTNPMRRHGSVLSVRQKDTYEEMIYLNRPPQCVSVIITSNSGKVVLFLLVPPPTWTQPYYLVSLVALIQGSWNEEGKRLALKQPLPINSHLIKLMKDRRPTE